MSNTTVDTTRATDSRTRVLISFAMAEGEAIFAMWLRNEIMKALGLYHERSVFLDSVTSRSGNKVTYTKPKHASDSAPQKRTAKDSLKERQGYATVHLDTREKSKVYLNTEAGKKLIAQPIGAENPQWKKMYRNAMEQADVMLFVYSTNWQNSPNCLQEYTDFLAEASKRNPSRPLRGIGLNLEGVATRSENYNIKPANIPKEHKVSVVQGTVVDQLGLSGFTLTSSALNTLIKEIKANLH